MVISHTVMDEMGPKAKLPGDLELWTKIYSPEKLSEFGKRFDQAEREAAPDKEAVERVKRPGQYIWLLENLGSNLTFSANTYPMKSSASQASGVEFRHNGKANALFMDGHCESMEKRKLYGTASQYTYSEKP